MKSFKRENKERDDFLAALFFIFLVLKLCKVIDWSWWFVTMPMWILSALFAFRLLIFLINPFKPKPKPKEKSRWQQKYDQMMESQAKINEIKSKIK